MEWPNANTKLILILIIHILKIDLKYLWHGVVEHVKNGDDSKDRGNPQCDTRRRRTPRQQETDPGDDHDQCAWSVHVDKEITCHSFKSKRCFYTGPVA